VLRVAPPRMSADGDTALLLVQYDVPVTDPDVYEDITPIEEVVQPYRDAGLQVELGGELPGTAVSPMEGIGELIGIVTSDDLLRALLGVIETATLERISVELAGPPDA